MNSQPGRPFWFGPLLVGGATLVLVIGLGIGLVRLLPARSGKPAPAPTSPAPETAMLPERPSPAPPPSPAPDADPGVKPDEGRVPELPGPNTVDVPRKPPDPQPVEKKAVLSRPKPADPPAKRATIELEVGDKFYQEAVVSRLSSYTSLAGPFAQNTRYALLSRFEVVQKKADGSLVVKQKMEGVRLSNTDRALQAQLNALLQKTKGATFTYELDPRRQVVRFEGPREAVKVFRGANPLGGQTFLLWSFLDADGWKELAQLTFFRPQVLPLKKGATWSVPMMHSWGPLGSWVGRAVFAYVDKKDGLDRFQYALNLAHRPPIGAGGLPIQIGKTDFRIQTAGGAIAYDSSKGRVAGFEERFHVRGVMAVSALGVDTAITMDEAQVFQVRILDENPWKE
jgi:hypothetical protein